LAFAFSFEDAQKFGGGRCRRRTAGEPTDHV